MSFKLYDAAIDDFLREGELVTPPTKTTIKVNKDKSITVGAMVYCLVPTVQSSPETLL